MQTHLDCRRNKTECAGRVESEGKNNGRTNNPGYPVPLSQRIYMAQFTSETASKARKRKAGLYRWRNTCQRRHRLVAGW